MADKSTVLNSFAKFFLAAACLFLLCPLTACKAQGQDYSKLEENLKTAVLEKDIEGNEMMPVESLRFLQVEKAEKADGAYQISGSFLCHESAFNGDYFIEFSLRAENLQGPVKPEDISFDTVYLVVKASNDLPQELQP